MAQFVIAQVDGYEGSDVATKLVADANGRIHFRHMLNETRQHMSEENVDALPEAIDTVRN